MRRVLVVASIFVAVQHAQALSAPQPASLGALAVAYHAGDFARVRALPLAALEKRTRVPDYLAYFVAEACLLDGKYAEAERRFALLGKKFPRFAVRARAGEADAAWRAGHRAIALKLYGELARSADKSIDQAVVHTRLAEGLQSAPAHWRAVVIEQPNHPLATAAMSKLARPLAVAEQIQRARNLIRDRAWKQAADELTALGDHADGDRAELDYWIGTALYKTRHGYEEAARRLLAAAPGLSGDRKADAMFHGARALSRADKDDEALVAYRAVVEQQAHSRPAAEAAFLLGWLEFNRGRYNEAREPLEQMIKRYPASPFATDARWILGFSQLLLGNHEIAAGHLGKLSDKGGALIGGKGRYWLARTRVLQHKKDDAIAIYRKLVSDYPLTYYAQLARLRLHELSVEVAPFGDAPRSNGAPAWDPSAKDKVSADPAFARAAELADAGLHAQAAEELRTVEADLIKKHTAARALPALMTAYAKSQRFARPHRLAEGYGGSALKLDPHRDAAARPWWEWMYPLAHRAYVEKYGPLGENPPQYLYTIMQKESAYDPNDVSYADAIGLLQMIPPTSRKVAKTIGLDYTDDLLYDPAGNIQLGAWYIGHLLKKFKGQIPIGAGSYNAGPKAMVKWLVQNGKRPLDEFIELCSYTQTREYMKKVIDIYSHYVWLYGHDDYLPSLTVDADYLGNDGIDY